MLHSWCSFIPAGAFDQANLRQYEERDQVLGQVPHTNYADCCVLLRLAANVVVTKEVRRQNLPLATGAVGHMASIVCTLMAKMRKARLLRGAQHVCILGALLHVWLHMGRTCSPSFNMLVHSHLAAINFCRAMPSHFTSPRVLRFQWPTLWP